MSHNKLFVSFTGLMYRLREGAVSMSDLSTGLFFFGCTREHVLTPGANGEPVESVVTERPDIHAVVVAAILEAEGTGRIAWRSREDDTSRFAILLPLLAGNGHQVGNAEALLSVWNCNRQYQLGHYSYPAVHDLLEDLKLDLTVVS